jgi:hypothetical protein
VGILPAHSGRERDAPAWSLHIWYGPPPYQTLKHYNADPIYGFGDYQSDSGGDLDIGSSRGYRSKATSA